MSTPRSVTETRSNILGVTGLPRAVLADLFRSRGLFGRDSRLASAEQAVVQSRIPAIPGVPTLPVPVLQTPRLKALAEFTDALVAGRDAVTARERLLREGLSSAAMSEAAITVDNVRVVFGEFRIAAPAITPIAVELPRAA